MRTTPSFLRLYFGLVAASSSVLAAAEPRIESTVVGPAGVGGLYVVSQNDARVAYVGAKGTRTVVSVDGVEGPLLDELFNGSAANITAAGQVLVHNANSGGKFNGTPSAVIFSDTGSHYAYVGRQGNDYVVVHDGKEVGRGPRNSLSLQHSPLGLSPKGNFAFWGEMKTEGGRGVYRLIVNGKPEPWAGHQDLKPVFSADDKHYAYLAGSAEDYRKPMLVRDGKIAGYVGGNPQFTADNKLLLTATDLKGVLVDGKPMSINAYIGVEKVTCAPVGGRFAVIVRKKNVNHEGVGSLYLDGREVSGTEGAMDITFSPDGKRWALRCKNPEAKSFFMVIDGKKGTEYQGISDQIAWSPDSTKVIYSISNSGRNFVVVNTEEFPVHLIGGVRSPFVFAKTGGRYAFSSVDGSNREFLTVVDGKNVLPPGFRPNGDTFDFSDDGARYAFVIQPATRNEIGGLIIDGVVNNSLTASSFQGAGWTNPAGNPFFKFSPDGKYLARMARQPDNTNPGLYINDKLVYPSGTMVTNPGFTPDGKHLFWLAREKLPDRAQLYNIVYVDGHPAVKLSGDNFQGTKGAWQVDDKGVLTFIGVVDNAVTRFRITPAADMNIDKLITEAGEKQAAAIAAAATAKKKTEDEAHAAAEKKKADAEAAAAKRKADLDALAAKRKEDYDAKVKARADALAARKQAAADAAAARAAKQKE